MTQDELFKRVRELLVLATRKQEWGYGFFPGGDPRKFNLDMDSNSEAQIASFEAFRKAYDEAEREGRLLPDGKEGWSVPGTGAVDGGWMGSYEWHEPYHQAVLEAWDAFVEDDKKCVKKYVSDGNIVPYRSNEYRRGLLEEVFRSGELEAK